jgi:hypothetical protein
MTTKKPHELTGDDVVITDAERQFRYPAEVLQVIARPNGERFEVHLWGSTKYPVKVDVPKDHDFLVFGEGETWCEKHGITTVLESGRNEGFGAGYVYWAKLACGCDEMEDASYLED